MPSVRELAVLYLILSVSTSMSDPDDASKEVGHALLRQQIKQHITRMITRLTGLPLEYSAIDKDSNVKNYPIFTLLSLTKRIMQTACPAVNRDFFELAFNAFVGLHIEFLSEEPYLRYDTYQRILIALRRCLQHSTPHIFLRSSNQTIYLSETETCDEYQMLETSQHILVSTQNRRKQLKFSIPLVAESKLQHPQYAEPLIETVWKMFLHSQSYCFRYFGEHYNDHHTFTAVIPQIFSNKIKEVWLKGYVLDRDSESKLYGGLLGNLTQTMMDVDNCVGAATAATPYTWFMGRPNFKRKNSLVNATSPKDADPDKLGPEDTPVRRSGRRMQGEFELESSSESETYTDGVDAPDLYFMES